jgi:hypothetical protein
MPRALKRIAIIIVYLLIFSLSGYFLYKVSRPDPTCFDKEKNQGEEEIDCGGPCPSCQREIDVQPLLVTEKELVYGGYGKFDVVFKVFNPNNNFGSSKFDYDLVLTGKNENDTKKISGSEFILPAENKYVVVTGLEASADFYLAGIEITNTQWQEFIEFDKPQLNIYNKRYNLISGGTAYSEAFGLLRNESPFDFSEIKIKVILRGIDGKPVAVNSTEMRTVSAGEQRDFRLIWPVSFPGDVAQVEMSAEADVFNSQNFLKKYLPGGRFQQYQ